MNYLQGENKDFNGSNLAKNQYTISLIKECIRVKILCENYIYNVQIKIANILKKLIMKYTRGESSSVPIEKAEKLIISIWYTLDAYITSFEKVEDSISALQNEDIEEMYLKGKEILEEEFSNTKKLYDEVVKNKIRTELTAYNDTLNGVGEFFEYYNLEFEPDEVPGSIDYPLAFDNWDIKGLYYIKNYIWNLYIENKICNYFKISHIENVLNYYGKIYDIDYRDLLINIFGFTITNALFSIICKNYSGDLRISEVQFNYLEKKLSKLNKEEINILISASLNKLLDELGIRDEYEIYYINEYKKNILKITINAVRKNNLRNILVVTEMKKNEKNKIKISNQNELDDEEFRQVIEEIMNCDEVFEKINIIKDNINSIKDFIDLLKSICLFEDEYLYLFRSLSNIEIALLGRYVFFNEYRMDKLNIQKIIDKKLDLVNEWQECFIEYLRGLSPEELKSIEGIINNIE